MAEEALAGREYHPFKTSLWINPLKACVTSDTQSSFYIWDQYILACLAKTGSLSLYSDILNSQILMVFSVVSLYYCLLQLSNCSSKQANDEKALAIGNHS